MAQQLEHAAIEAAVNELQTKLDRLRILYDQYFMGISKREPLEALKDVVRIVRLLEQQQIRNTSLRFRLRSLVQKLNVQRTLWQRTIRSIEQGTHRRELRRLRNRLVEEGVDPADVGHLRTTGDVERAMSALATAKSKQAAEKRRTVASLRGKPAEQLRRELEQKTAGQPAVEGEQPPAPLSEAEAPQLPTSTAATATPPIPTQKAPARRAQPGAAKAISGDDLQSLYRRYIKAKRMVGESIDSLSIDSLRRTIERQMPKLQQLHPGRSIEFHVIVRQGKAILKAKPKD